MAAVLPGGDFPYLETFLIITTREVRAAGIYWAEDGEAAEHPLMNIAAPPGSKE